MRYSPETAITWLKHSSGGSRLELAQTVVFVLSLMVGRRLATKVQHCTRDCELVHIYISRKAHISAEYRSSLFTYSAAYDTD